MRSFLKILLLFFITASTLVGEHGDLDKRIADLSSTIAISPDSAELYFQRGKLRLQHEEYELCIADIKTSMQKGYLHDFQNIYLAKSFINIKQYQNALLSLNDFDKLNPSHVVSMKLRAKALYGLNEFKSAAEWYEKVIHNTIKSLPENYLEASNAWMSSNVSSKYDKSVQILELGLEKLGPIITLQNELIEIHLVNENYDKAIEQQKSIIDHTQRKESSLYRLAEIYAQIGDDENAIIALKEAKIHLDNLPLRIRKNSAMQALDQKIKQLTTKLN